MKGEKSWNVHIEKNLQLEDCHSYKIWEKSCPTFDFDLSQKCFCLFQSNVIGWKKVKKEDLVKGIEKCWPPLFCLNCADALFCCTFSPFGCYFFCS